MDFRVFDSSIIFILRGRLSRPIGDFPENLSQAINLSRDDVSRDIARACGSRWAAMRRRQTSASGSAAATLHPERPTPMYVQDPYIPTLLQTMGTMMEPCWYIGVLYIWVLVFMIHPFRIARFRRTRFSEGPGRPDALILTGGRNTFLGLGPEGPKSCDVQGGQLVLHYLSNACVLQKWRTT